MEAKKSSMTPISQDEARALFCMIGNSYERNRESPFVGFEKSLPLQSNNGS